MFGQFVILFVALATVACIRDPDPFTVDADDVAVHMILEAGADSAFAIVETPGNAIEGAVVRLILGEDTTRLTFTDSSCVDPWYGLLDQEGCHRGELSSPIQPGAAYSLEVLLPGGGRVTGTTTVPLPLTLVSPADGERITAGCGSGDSCFGTYVDEPPFNIPVATVVFRWLESADPDRLNALLRARTTFLDGEEYGPAEGCRLGSTFFRSSPATADSLVLPIPNIGCDPEDLRPARFDSIHADAIAYVWNREIQRYNETVGLGSTRETGVSVGLEGAWGLFGAVTPTTTIITIVRDPPPAP